MKLLSVSVGSPRQIEWKGKLVRTSIFKFPKAGPVRVTKLNLDGDEQSDLSVHGGIDKAVYAYPSEHYPFWREELARSDLSWGFFGENLTTEGVLETALHIGDTLRVGSAKFVVTQPRLPCFKLGIRFGRPDIVDRFSRSGRSGFYLAVLQEGEVAAGDSIELLTRDKESVTVAEVVSLYERGTKNRDLLRRVSELTALPSSMRDHFCTQLQRLMEK
jgi:MOSC domain-containing protein YiiM